MTVRRFTTALFLFLVFAGLASTPAPSEKGKIAFSVEYPWGLYVLDLDSREIEKLEVGGNEIGQIAYNRKKNLLAFESAEHEDIPSICIPDLSTKQTYRLYEPTGFDEARYMPAFHPDGEYLLLVSQEGKIFRHDIKTRKWTEVELVHSDYSDFFGMSFSDAGTKVALMSGLRGKGLLIGDISGNRITVKSHILKDIPVFSGRWIGDNELVFTGMRSDRGCAQLWRLSLPDKLLRQLTQPNLFVRGNIGLSSDKKWIVFAGASDDRPGEWVLWRVSAEGEGLERLTSHEDLHGQSSPVWIE